MNGGLQVVNPSTKVYKRILEHMSSDAAINMDFADQSLLSDLFRGRWVPLPYVYNALKTLRWKDVHSPIWRDHEVKNIHYILSPKPWDTIDELGNAAASDDPTFSWWVEVNTERLKLEKEKGIERDGF